MCAPALAFVLIFAASTWRDWPAWAVAAFTLGLLIVAVLQWAAMHGQRKLMGEQLAEMKTTSADTHNLALAAKDTAKATADLVQVTQRAWILVDVKLAEDIVFDHDGDLRISLRCDIKNVGHTPANNIQMRSKLMFWKTDGFESNLRVSRAQSELADQPPYGQLGITLFPQEPETFYQMLFARKSDFEDALHDPDEGSTTPRIAPVVVGCIVYEYPNSPTHHATRFAHSIYRKSSRIPQPPPYQPGIDVGVTLRNHPDDVVFARFFLGGNEAD